MKIALIGYGKMGQAIEALAKERGHEIVLVIDINNQHEFTTENLQKADVAIEFTVPSTAYNNYLKCFEAGVPIVTGTTGWLDKMDEITAKCEKEGKGFFYASNFSLGVNIFFKINEYLAKIMNAYPDYDVAMEEIHHTQKLDAPSGTAITLAEGVLNNMERKTGWECNDYTGTEHLHIAAKRLGTVPGTHTITYDSAVDEIEIMHRAKSRQGFVMGAVLAAEYMKGKSGIHNMNDLIQL